MLYYVLTYGNSLSLRSLKKSPGVKIASNLGKMIKKCLHDLSQNICKNYTRIACFIER